MNHTEFTAIRKTIGTQEDVAELLDISRRTLCALESGSKPITPEDEAAIRSLLNAADPAPEPAAEHPGRHMDAKPTAKHDPLTANILHWYVSPGYVLPLK